MSSEFVPVGTGAGAGVGDSMELDEDFQMQIEVAEVLAGCSAGDGDSMDIVEKIQKKIEAAEILVGLGASMEMDEDTQKKYEAAQTLVRFSDGDSTEMDEDLQKKLEVAKTLVALPEMIRERELGLGKNVDSGSSHVAKRRIQILPDHDYGQRSPRSAKSTARKRKGRGRPSKSKRSKSAAPADELEDEDQDQEYGVYIHPLEFAENHPASKINPWIEWTEKSVAMYIDYFDKYVMNKTTQDVVWSLMSAYTVPYKDYLIHTPGTRKCCEEDEENVIHCQVLKRARDCFWERAKILYLYMYPNMKKYDWYVNEKIGTILRETPKEDIEHFYRDNSKAGICQEYITMFAKVPPTQQEKKIFYVCYQEGVRVSSPPPLSEIIQKHGEVYEKPFKFYWEKK